MGILEIVLLIAVVVLLIVSLSIHFDRKKTHAVYQFMADMVSEEGGALQKALEELKDSSKYADPAESAAAITEIVRFLESFNSTVRKQAERIEEAEKNKWYKLITGLLKKKKRVDYSSLIKKKAGDKKEPEKKKEEPKTEEDLKAQEEKAELEKIEEKIEKKLLEEEPKPKKIKKVIRRIKKKRAGALQKPEGEAAEAEEKKVSGENDTDIDLTPPPDGTS